MVLHSTTPVHRSPGKTGVSWWGDDMEPAAHSRLPPEISQPKAKPRRVPFGLQVSRFGVSLTEKLNRCSYSSMNASSGVRMGALFDTACPLLFCKSNTVLAKTSRQAFAKRAWLTKAPQQAPLRCSEALKDLHFLLHFKSPRKTNTDADQSASEAEQLLLI